MNKNHIRETSDGRRPNGLYDAVWAFDGGPQHELKKMPGVSPRHEENKR